jgi:phosphohistidine phosphatase
MSETRDAVRVLLMRHGAAVPGRADPPLSDAGRAAVRIAVTRPACAALSPLDRLIHSPLARAVETAALLRDAVGAGAVTVDDRVLPDAPAADAAAGVLAAIEAGDRRIAVVAHLPILPALAHRLCDATLPFDTAGGWLLGGDAATAGIGTLDLLEAIDAP